MTKIMRMKLSEITPLPFEPEERLVMDERMRALINEIKSRIERNMEPLPETERLLVGKDRVLGDGHRRLKALQIAGVQETLVEIDDERTGIEIFSHRASGKPMNSRCITQAAQLGLDIDHFPISQRITAKHIINKCGEEILEKIIESGLSIGGIYTIAKKIMRYCGRDDTEFAKKTILWLIEHHGQKLMRLAIEEYRLPPHTIEYTIEENIQLTLRA